MNPTQFQLTNSTVATQITLLLTAFLSKNVAYRHKVYAVGGYVRDHLLNVKSEDLDLVIEEKNGAEKLCRDLHLCFQHETSEPFQKGNGYPIWYLTFKTDVTFESHTYLTKGGTVDFADSQKECFPDPLSRQRITTFGSLAEDIRRRDFTINMLAMNLSTNEIIDLSGQGLTDLNTGLIRTHPQNSPDQIFNEDPLRMLRAIRFAIKYNFKIDESVVSSIRKNVQRMQILSAERIWDELKKIIQFKGFAKAIWQLIDFDLNRYILPNFNIQNLDVTLFQKCSDHIILNLIALFKNQELNITKDLLDRLKVETTIKKNVLNSILGINELSSMPQNTPLQKYRGFARKYSDQLQFIIPFSIESATRLQMATVIPIQKTTVLDGHNIMALFNVRGPDIQRIRNQALDLEDEFVLKYNLDAGHPQVQEAVLKNLKENYSL